MRSRISFPQPDDWHQHLREGDAITTPLAHAAAQFGRIMVMPNLSLPVTTAKLLGKYLDDITARMPVDAKLKVFGTLYLKPDVLLDEIALCMDRLPLLAIKWYPRGVTTNSSEGVEQIESCYPIFEAMQDSDLVLSVHGEVNQPDVDIFDREAVFVRKILLPLMNRFPRLRVVLEHISTRVAVDCVRSFTDGRLAATITAHHLLVNRHDMLDGGIKPHLYCLPIVKREEDRKALIEAATSGDYRFFLGSDSAPHPQSDKESCCGCAGCYTGAHAMELYAHAFDSVGEINRLEHFASSFGAEFYRLDPAEGEIELEKHSHKVPASYQSAAQPLVPFWANQQVNWRVTAFS